MGFLYVLLLAVTALFQFAPLSGAAGEVGDFCREVCMRVGAFANVSVCLVLRSMWTSLISHKWRRNG